MVQFGFRLQCCQLIDSISISFYTDADVVRFLKILTFLDLEVVEDIGRQMKASCYAPNSAQRRLAEEVTRFVHGQDGLDEAIKATEALRPGAETVLDWKAIDASAQDVPSCSLPYGEVLNSSLGGLSVSSGLFETKSAGKKTCQEFT